MSVLQKERPFKLHMQCRDNDGLLRLQWLKLTVLLLSSGGSTITQCTGCRNAGGHKSSCQSRDIPLTIILNAQHLVMETQAILHTISPIVLVYSVCPLTTVTKSANGAFLRMHSSHEVILDCTLRICIIGFYINIILQSHIVQNTPKVCL